MMNYANNMTFQNWVDAINGRATSLIGDIVYGKMLADKFNAMTYGLNATQIAALPQFAGTGVTANDATNMMYATGVFTDLYNALYNVANLAQAYRLGYLEPFV
jgi:hypothetical protein